MSKLIASQNLGFSWAVWHSRTCGILQQQHRFGCLCSRRYAATLSPIVSAGFQFQTLKNSRHQACKMISSVLGLVLANMYYTYRTVLRYSSTVPVSLNAQMTTPASTYVCSAMSLILRGSALGGSFLISCGGLPICPLLAAQMHPAPLQETRTGVSCA